MWDWSEQLHGETISILKSWQCALWPREIYDERRDGCPPVVPTSTRAQLRRKARIELDARLMSFF